MYACNMYRIYVFCFCFCARVCKFQIFFFSRFTLRHIHTFLCKRNPSVVVIFVMSFSAALFMDLAGILTVVIMTSGGLHPGVVLSHCAAHPQ